MQMEYEKKSNRRSSMFANMLWSCPQWMRLLTVFRSVQRTFNVSFGDGPGLVRNRCVLGWSIERNNGGGFLFGIGFTNLH